ncbi:VWA domain-containing protein [Paenactinomyces guangxiensis]|uniref:VWA domain-containing protein n=1 Tax=Paenactinomyces guangxiensis TaxID=1490290 RepID=A0A7W2A6N0_9BACL|nr:VWA domain-containing protein [Paenactinomyces guangxiensis]MBA4492725.1 VWA domain-containing protein [Paenactinomyces guangxiensis]MBH8590426.1 VWA domain-containing protein [Paenactinomyces guangxiensis]
MRPAKRLLIACLICFSWTLSGCASVIQQIQQTTGSKIEKVDELASQAAEEEEAEEKVIVKEDEIPKSPSPHIELKQILNDIGKGKYAGDNYDQSKVTKALNQMPKGLSEDKAYAYLLGLVGESYKKDVEIFDGMENPDYGEKLRALEALIPPKAKEKPPAAKPNPAQAQKPPEPPPKKANIVVLLDASGSMGGKMDGQEKMAEVEEAIRDFAAKLPKERYTLTLRVYGHKGSNKKKDKALSCSDVEKVYMANQYDAKKLASVFNKVNPTGWTPFAYAISSSYQDMQKGTPDTVENMVLVISDGSDTCGGNPLEAARLINRSQFRAKVHIIGLDVEHEIENELRKVSDITGGDYRTVENAEELKETLQTRVKDVQQLNAPWAQRAAEAIYQSYRYDDQRLEKHYEKIVTKSDQEYKRLDEANDYIKEKGKIDGEAWVEIGSWIDHRWKQVGGYADERQENIGEALDEEWKESFGELEKVWQENGGKPQDLAKIKREKIEEELESKIREGKDRIGKMRVPVGETATDRSE